MDDNQATTADGGVGTCEQVQDLEGAASPPDVDAPEEFHDFNRALRMEFLECNLRIQQARAAGDTVAEARARRDRESIAGRFVAKNVRLARSTAAPLLIKGGDLSAEHLQAAQLGLWEAFVGTEPDLVDAVEVASDGTLHPVAGWDPARGTFGTWARSFITGRTRRSVRSAENAFTGLSYNTWGKKPAVDRARQDLTAELGRAPSVQEIAERAQVTVDTVRACSTSAPASLDTSVGDDSGTTLADLIERTEAADTSSELPSADLELELTKRAAAVGTFDLFVLLLRLGVIGNAKSIVQTADTLAVRRSAIRPAWDRAAATLGLPDPLEEDETALLA